MKVDTTILHNKDASPSEPLPPPDEIDRLTKKQLHVMIARLAALQAMAAARLEGCTDEEECGKRANSDPDGLLDVERAAEFLALPSSYVADLGRRGLLPRVTCGKYVRFRLADLRDWIHAHRDPGVDRAEIRDVSLVSHERRRGSTHSSATQTDAATIRRTRGRGS